MTGLLGWTLGRFVFGIIGDYFGRIRVLMLSVILLAIRTALQRLTHSSLTSGLCRFLTGAELDLGILLVAEAFADVHRAKVLSVMMTGAALAIWSAGGFSPW